MLKRDHQERVALQMLETTRCPRAACACVLDRSENTGHRIWRGRIADYFVMMILCTSVTYTYNTILA